MELSSIRRLRRVPFLDEVRGADLLLMIFYHGVYDLVDIFGVNFPAFYGWGFRTLQLLICSVFIVVSGICCRYSRANLKRGAQTLGVGMLFTLVTWFVMPSQLITFGILHFLGCAMMAFALLEKLLDRIAPFWGACIMLLLFFLTRPIAEGALGLPGLTVTLPRALYDVGFLSPLGFLGGGFHSADYFPLLPWLFLFLAGSYLGVFFTSEAMPRALYRSHVPFLAAIGRRSLLVYVLHQPLLYGLLWVFFAVRGALVG